MMAALASIFSGLWRYLAMIVGAWLVHAKVKESGKTEAAAEELKREADAAKRITEAQATARPATDTLPERLRRNDW